jgi:hypothetical protein
VSLASKDNLNAQCIEMSAWGAEGMMERYPMAFADEALDVAFQFGALKHCPKQPHVIVRMIAAPSGKRTSLWRG